ncbi:cupin domain-containing protein [Halomonas icarae]|uniref:Cupin domain-containing protein n=1 Tax=Halomonas icarae TaxID=2691040 RepID=A0A7X4W1S0_9GAMM|nr:cupin domain-containing protein [Halomonas icarae]MDR5903508.1 cupin domain-containing protein [Halomonas icarae]NAW14202.1 cupin domain-containing protein [Halomonas icarae]
MKPLLALAPLLLFAAEGLMAEDSASTFGPEGLTITPILEATETITGQPIHFPQGNNQLVAVLAEIEPGGQVGRHLHPVPLFVYMLEGQLSIEIEGHGIKTFDAGQGFAEVINTWHNGRNPGDVPARLLIVFSGQQGTPNLIRP